MVRYKPVLLGERNSKETTGERNSKETTGERNTKETAGWRRFPDNFDKFPQYTPAPETSEPMEEYFSDISFCSSESEIFSDVSLLDSSSIPTLESMISALSSQTESSGESGLSSSLLSSTSHFSFTRSQTSTGFFQTFKDASFDSGVSCLDSADSIISGLQSSDSGISDDSTLGVMESFSESTLHVF